MPSSKPAERYRDILNNIAKISLYVDGYSRERFLADEKTLDAVERCLSRISEAAVKLGDKAESAAPGIPWRDIRGLGNNLRHAYDGVDPDILWNLIQKDLEPLAVACRFVLERHGRENTCS